MSICDLCQLSSPSGCTKLDNEVCLKDALKLIKASATNGDVITTLYPDANPEEDIQEPHYILFTLNGFCFSISKEWWNSPYKAGDID